MNTASSLLLVGLVSVLVYLNSLGGGFVFDDHRAILTNDDLNSWKTSLHELLTHDFWGGAMSRRESHKSYRPLTVLTYRYFNYYWTELQPFSYHLVNVIMHAIVSMLFLPVTQLVLGSSNKDWPLLTVLLFATHSIHTEAVASVVGRAELICCFFFLLSFLSYAHAVPQRCKSPDGRRSTIFIALSILFAFLSMLSKEQGITAIGVCASYDILIHWPGVVRTTLPSAISTSGAGKFTEIPRDYKTVVKRVCFLAIAGAAIMWFRILLNQGSDPIFKPEEMRAAFHTNRTVSNIYTWNMWLLIAPSPLCCDWSLGSIPIVDTLYDIRNIWSAILCIGLGSLLITVMRSEDAESGIGLAFMIIPFVPSTGLVVKVGFVIAERILYLPSLGYCLLVMIGAKRLSQRIANKKLVQVAIMFLLVVMSAKTVSRNWDWWSDLALFQSGVKANPNNVKMHNNYAMELKSAGRIEEAQEYYKTAMQIEPDYAEVYFNYGNLLSETRDFEEAVYYFEKAMTFPHMYSKTLNNVATMYFKLGKYKEAERKFKESLAINPDQPMTYNNLASLYGETKRFEESEEMFKKTIDMRPNYTEAYFNLGTLLYQMGRVQEGEKYLLQALKLNPNHHGALNNLKVIEYYRNKKK